jgi:hypothetical protein
MMTYLRELQKSCTAGTKMGDYEVRARILVWVTLRARLVTLRARWVTLRARWVTLRARWVTLRARWVTLRAGWVTLRARWVTLRARWVTLRGSLGDVQVAIADDFEYTDPIDGSVAKGQVGPRACAVEGFSFGGKAAS